MYAAHWSLGSWCGTEIIQIVIKFIPHTFRTGTVRCPKSKLCYVRRVRAVRVVQSVNFVDICRERGVDDRQERSLVKSERFHVPFHPNPPIRSLLKQNNRFAYMWSPAGGLSNLQMTGLSDLLGGSASAPRISSIPHPQATRPAPHLKPTLPNFTPITITPTHNHGHERRHGHGPYGRRRLLHG